MTYTVETYQGIVVPESALVKPERKDRYGRVPGLDDEELAEPEELERQVLRQEFGAILALPNPSRRGDIGAAVDEPGGVDWDAFGTVDFAEAGPATNRARQEDQQLRERLKHKLILLAIVKERLPGRAKYLVLKCVRMGIIKLEHVVSDDMLAVARLYLEVRKLQKELWQIQEASRRRKQRQYERWLEARG